ncbi:MAG: trehalase family glycosidase, partial [Planctomycetota bacterium]
MLLKDQTESQIGATETLLPLATRTGRRDNHIADLVREGVRVDHYGENQTGLPYFTGYSYDTLYDWDQYFEAVVQLYLGLPPEHALNGVRIFISRQHDDGFIARSVPSTPTHDHEHVKPFLAQIVLLCHRGWPGDEALSLLQEPGVLDGLAHYLRYWCESCDAGGEFAGLSVWQSAPHTGMDNQHERAGGWRDVVSAGVDLNCYLVRELRAMAELCDLAGGDWAARAGEYRDAADRRATLVREQLWDDEAGFFFDGNARKDEDVWCRNAPRGSVLWNANRDRLIRVSSVSGFAPLFAGVATPEQTRRLVDDHLLDPTRFWTPAPVPALSRGEHGYTPTPLPGDVGCSWRANAWLPTNYMLVHGLRRYGYDQL